MHGGGILSAPLWLAADDLRAGRASERGSSETLKPIGTIYVTEDRIIIRW